METKFIFKFLFFLFFYVLNTTEAIMAWNEPGNGDKKDPWLQGDKRKDNDAPPDLSEIFDKLKQKFTGKTGGGNNNSNNNGKNTNAKAKKTGGFGLSFLVLALALLLWFIMGFYMVDQTEQALVLRFGKYNSIQGAGLHWNPPLVDTVYKVNTTRLRKLDQKSTMLTKDENLVEIVISMQYTVNDIKLYLLNVRDPDKSLANSLDSALRHEVGGTDLDSILTKGREILGDQVKSRLISYAKSYGLGVNVETLNIKSTSAPSQVQDAFDDVVRAKEDKERSVNQANAYENSILPEASGQAERIKQEALAYKEGSIAQAEGDASRFNSLLKEYRKAPQVTRDRLYLDTMQKVLANTSKVVIDKNGGQNVLYLPLDQLQRQSSGASTNTNVNGAYKSAESVNNSERLDNLAEEVSRRIQNQSNSNTSSRGGR